MKGITIHGNRILAEKPDMCRVGINVNYILDGEWFLKKGRGVAAALKEMGVKVIRYPGGNKSDGYLWSTPPYEKPRVTLARPGGYEFPSNVPWIVNRDKKTFRRKPLDFDRFIELCREVGAEPLICVNHDSMFKPPKKPDAAIPTRDDLLAHATSWVRYANIEKGYGIRYWEIGNESYLNHWVSGITGEKYAQSLVAFSSVMKAVDPSIWIGANGHVSAGALGRADEQAWLEARKRNRRSRRPDSWWKSVLSIASKHIDFLVVHPYPCNRWGRYDAYIGLTPDYTEATSGAREAIRRWAPARDRGRLKVCATEANSADWSRPRENAWAHENTLGHALVLFDLIGAHLARKDSDMVLVWNTRWLWWWHSKQLWDAVDDRNELNPTGRAIAIWNKFLKDRIVRVSGLEDCPCYATTSHDRRRASVLVINKGRVSARLPVRLHGMGRIRGGVRWTLTGKSPNDFSPVWRRAGKVSVARWRTEVCLPPFSLTVLDLRG